MSRAWRVIAPGRKETTGSLGELIDALLSGSATGLVPLLAVPLKLHRSLYSIAIEGLKKLTELQS